MLLGIEAIRWLVRRNSTFLEFNFKFDLPFWRSALQGVVPEINPRTPPIVDVVLFVHYMALLNIISFLFLQLVELCTLDL